MDDITDQTEPQHSTTEDKRTRFANNVARRTLPVRPAPEKVSTLSKDMWTIYDNTIGTRVIKGPLKKGHYAILDIYEINKRLLITWGATFTICFREMKKRTAKPLCIINCMNFGHPDDSMEDFKNTIEQLNKECKKHHIPVVGGNVSLYNATQKISIVPSPVFVMVGLIEQHVADRANRTNRTRL